MNESVIIPRLLPSLLASPPHPSHPPSARFSASRRGPSCSGRTVRIITGHRGRPRPAPGDIFLRLSALQLIVHRDYRLARSPSLEISMLLINGAPMKNTISARASADEGTERYLSIYLREVGEKPRTHTHARARETPSLTRTRDIAGSLRAISRFRDGFRNLRSSIIARLETR